MLPRKKQSGFSLVEVLVVAGIIALAFMGVLGLIRRSITLSYANQNYLSGNLLAQEGLELARYVRDQNWLTNRTFAADLANQIGTGDTTVLVLDARALNARSNIKQLYNSQDGVINPPDCGLGDSFDLSAYVKSDCALVFQDKNDGNRYVARVVGGISNGDSRYKKTIFHRLVAVTYHNNGTIDTVADDYLYVASMVYWKDRGSEKYITLGTYLYDYSWKY